MIEDDPRPNREEAVEAVCAIGRGGSQASEPSRVVLERVVRALAEHWERRASRWEAIYGKNDADLMNTVIQQCLNDLRNSEIGKCPNDSSYATSHPSQNSTGETK